MRRAPSRIIDSDDSKQRMVGACGVVKCAQIESFLVFICIGGGCADDMRLMVIKSGHILYSISLLRFQFQ